MGQVEIFFTLEVGGDEVKARRNAGGEAIELAPWGISVSALIVGSVQTPIWEKASHTAETMLRGTPPEAWELYGKIPSCTLAGLAN